MVAKARVLVTHIFSMGRTAKISGTATGGASDGSTLIDATAAPFVAGNVDDVLRITSGPNAGQAAVIKSRTTTTLTFYKPLNDPVLGGTTYRVEAPRQATDLTPDILGIDLKDAITDLTGIITLDVANPDRKYEGLFKDRDPIEVWIDDGNDGDTPALLYVEGTATGGSTTTIVDTGKDFTVLGVQVGDTVHFNGPTTYQSATITVVAATTLTFATVSQAPASGTPYVVLRDNQRCFIGRIDRQPRTSGEELSLQIIARDYAADLMDAFTNFIFFNKYPTQPNGPIIGTAWDEEILTELNGSPMDTVGTPSEGRLGMMRDRATGRPTFAKSVSTLAFQNVPKGDVAFITETYFDVFARVANLCTDTNGEPLQYWVDSFTYYPRRQNTDADDRPPAGDTAGPGNPTINLKTRQDAAGSAVSWGIREGENLLPSTSLKESERSRNLINLQGTDGKGTPTLVTVKQSGSGIDAHLQDVLGRDRYGDLAGYSTAEGYIDAFAAEAAATAALIKSKASKERRTLTRLMIVEPGRKMSGLKISVQAPSLGIDPATTLGTTLVRSRFMTTGYVTEFDVTNIRPGWDRLLSPLQKSTQKTIREDVWKTWWVYVFQKRASGDAEVVDVYRVEPGRYGDSGAEQFLYTVSPPGSFTTSDDKFVDAKWSDGRICLMWQSLAGGAIGFQVVDAVTGTTWNSYVNMDDGFPILRNAEFADSEMLGGLWFLQSTFGDDPVFEVWIGVAGAYQQILLHKGSDKAKSTSGLYKASSTFHVSGLQRQQGFFIEVRDDGHKIVHTFQAAVPITLTKWATVDLDSQSGNPSTNLSFELQEGFSVPFISSMLTTSDRFLGFSLYVSRNFSHLRGNSRWAAPQYDRSIGSGGGSGRAFSALDIVPFTRFSG